MKNIVVKDKIINITGVNDDDYVSLTDIARIKNPKEPKDVVKNWLRLRSTLEFLGLWEKINNPNFKGIEFDPLLSEAGKNITINYGCTFILAGLIVLEDNVLIAPNVRIATVNHDYNDRLNTYHFKKVVIKENVWYV